MMKKSIFAVAVASALTFGAAQAETILYGSIRYDYESKKNEEAYNAGNGRIGFDGERLSNLEDAGSRIGIKGSEDLGNGNAVIYNLEWGFDGMTQDESDGWRTRKAILGLTGDWGTFTAGRQNNPFKDTIVDESVVDDFNGSNVISSASQRAMTTALTGQQAAGYYNYYNADGSLVTYPSAGNEYVAYGWHQNFDQADAKYSRVGKVIAYTTPEIAGFQANVALMMDDEFYRDGINEEKNVDLWTINARYAHDMGANGTILAKAGFIQAKLADNNKSKVWGLFLGYSQDAFSVTGSFAKGDHDSDNITLIPATGHSSPYTSFGKSKSQGWDIGASFSFGPNYFSTVRATYGESELKNNDNKDKVKSWAVGFEQKLSNRTRAWVEYGNEETTFSANHVDKRKDNVLSIGMRHDF